MSFQYELAKFINFRDQEKCEQVRSISKEDLTEHENDDFNIRIIEEPEDFYFEFALDIVRRIREANSKGQEFVGIFPVGPMPQYSLAAKMINQLEIPCDNLNIFAMDEYADQDGNTAPVSWPGSFQKAMLESFIKPIDEDLRPPMDQVHFPTSEVIDSYSQMMEDLGGVDICYGGIGWCGHIAFWESHLWEEFGDDLEAYKRAGPRTVELNPMTVMQNALHSFDGDWSQVPPKANTIGPGQITGADYRSFWLDGSIGGGISWQRFIARLVAQGPVTTKVPGSLLQTMPGTYTILGDVAEDIEIEMH